jgi:hypothetical protein
VLVKSSLGGSSIHHKSERGGEPLSRVGILRAIQWARAGWVWQDAAPTTYWDIATHSRKSEDIDVLPAGSLSMDRGGHYLLATVE